MLDYIVTKASVHDAKETVELITNAHPDNRYLLGDEGYLGKNLNQRLEQMGSIRFGHHIVKNIRVHAFAYFV